MSELGSAEGSIAKPFELGLVLAGAISAGAYTAGVLDFLFQALSEWEKKRGEPGVPDHRIAIKVIAGASAGAITGALGAVALARGLTPRTFDSLDPAPQFYPDHYGDRRQRLQCVLPAMYRTWVELPAMVAPGGRGLLGTRDIEAMRRDPVPIVRSLLDATVLDDIKVLAVEPYVNGMTVQPPFPFIAQRLHLYLTVSNMRGIPFKVEFGRSSYGMQTMGDRVHYVVNDLGSCDVSQPASWVELDAQQASMSISVQTLPTMQTGRLSNDWDLFGTSALASGAFPLGLSARRLSFGWQHYSQRRYPLPLPNNVVIQPNFPPGTAQLGNFVFESVDGGLVNNNPFDYAQFALTGKAAEPASGKNVEKAIVMVAPFPEPPEFPSEGSPSPAVTAIVRALFPALIAQARFRANELAPAIDERDYSRFLIAPLRRIPRTSAPPPDGMHPEQERFAIACGLLGGFGGFLDKKFRDHDFQLGRRNCQQFLRSSFDVTPDNVIVGRPGMTQAQPVIPLVGSAAGPIPLPVWPQMSEEDFAELCAHVKERVAAVIPALVRAQTPSIMLRTALRFGWRAFLRGRILKFVRLTMLADLVRRSQVAGWQAPPSLAAWAAERSRTLDDVQAVLAELVSPAFDYRTAAGISVATRLPPDFVREALVELSSTAVPEQVRSWQDGDRYTIYWRRPGFVGRLGPVRWFNRWWNRPTVDRESRS